MGTEATPGTPGSGQAGTPAPGTGAPAPTPAPSAAPAAGNDDTPPGTQGPGGNYLVPHSVWAKTKQKQRERGKREAMDELDKVAKEHGFASYKDALAFMGAMKSKGSGKPAGEKPERESGSGSSGGGKWGKQYEREKQQWAKERGELSSKLRHTTRKYSDLEQTLAAERAEWELQKLAISKGIKDPDYAVRLLTRHLESIGGSDPEKLKELKFDDAAFFDKLRESHPYLFGEVVKPVTTGTGPNGQPVPPKGTNGAPSNPATGFDARKASPEEFRAELARRGLNMEA